MYDFINGRGLLDFKKSVKRESRLGIFWRLDIWLFVWNLFRFALWLSLFFHLYFVYLKISTREKIKSLIFCFKSL